MKQLRVAILGQGRSGRDIHGAHIRADGRFRVVAVVDPLAERRARARDEYNLGEGDVYPSVEGLYGRADVDLAVNATPSLLHQPLALDLMRHGCHVLQEKPIAATAAQVDELAEVSRQTGRQLLIFLQSRYAPQFVKVREIAQSGALGRLVQIKLTTSGFGRRWDWQTLQENVAGSLYNTGPHPLGQALELMDCYDEMPSVFCRMDRVNTFGDAEDFVKLILTAPGRPLVEVEVSGCDGYVPYTFHIQGSCGSLIADSVAIRWKCFQPDEAPPQRLIREPLTNAQGLPSYCVEQLPWREFSWEQPNVVDNVFASATRRLYDDVYACLAEGGRPNVTIHQVRQQIEIIEEAHRQNPMRRLHG
ncbi:MAG: Gfo/Idh/MocA family oxidoreductase [Clostridiales bacterium]|nr:Gfo/Idh/MocA family oxidoreductase [Clostridiales bacterium]